VSGYDDLARGLSATSELGLDDARTHDALWAAINSGDLEDEDAGTAFGALGSCYHATRRQEEARECLERGIALSTMARALAVMHYELGETLHTLGCEPEAETHFRQSLEYDRQHPFGARHLELARSGGLRSCRWRPGNAR
jgi:tetratricopeptide (TPR) repeat protein